MSNKNTEGEAEVSEHGLCVFIDGSMIAETDFTLYGKGDKFANAARLVQGWNLLNRLEAMGVTAEQVPGIIEALKPFTHPDLLVSLGGNVEGDDSPVYGRNKAILKLKHFRNAAKSLTTTMKSEAEIGDYVVATKYEDGNPSDHWAVGFYAGLTNATKYDPPRFDVVDSNGNQFRGNGFRKMQKVSKEKGAWMLENARAIELSGQTVWHFLTP